MYWYGFTSTNTLSAHCVFVCARAPGARAPLRSTAAAFDCFGLQTRWPPSVNRDDSHSPAMFLS